MCGFLGQYSPLLSSKEVFLENLAIAKHRGPDQTGYWADAGVQFGFNRLAIVDLSEAGHQPMLSQPENWVIIFNGEIYNHLEIRKELTGYDFKGHSDTETILASFEHVGFEKTIEKLIGMFAIAAFSKADNKLFIARDSVGIKPFFYYSDSSNFWFASQFNQVIKGIGKENVALDPSGMRDFLQFGYMQAPNTIYENIKQLEPGQMAVVDGQSIKLKTFQKYPANVSDSGLSDNSEEALSEFNALFSKVCQDQLQADVPVSTFLSSGIDSTLVNAYARAFKPDLTAYTIGVGGEKTDERPVAEEYAKHLQINHISESIDKSELLKALPDHFEKLGEPFADFSSIPTYLICKKSKKKATVMLSGDGGDELFWGYDRMHNCTQAFPFFNDSLVLRRLKKKLKIFKKPESGAIYEFNHAHEMIENAHSHISLGIIKPIFNSKPKTQETEDIYTFSGDSQIEFRNWIRYNEFYAHMQRVLIKVDRMSMANSLEVRVPILDQRIVDFAWKLDSDFGLKKDKDLKGFLKKALGQHIPLAMMNQNKKGFYVPIGKWMKSELREEVETLLLHTPVYGGEFINKEVWIKFVTDFFENPKSGKEWAIWIMYSWQKWAKQLKSL